MPILLSAASRQRMPWKNGSGSTTEILVMPENADLSNFDWRISLATIASAGPFSIFPGIDRSLSLVDGAGVELQIGSPDASPDASPQTITLRNPLDQSELQLTQHTVQFPGEAQVFASLVDGASTDFNVMTRRTRCQHAFTRWQQHGSSSWQHSAAYSLLFVAELANQDALICRQDDTEFRLSQHDSLLFTEADAAHWQLSSTQPCKLFAVQIFFAEK